MSSEESQEKNIVTCHACGCEIDLDSGEEELDYVVYNDVFYCKDCCTTCSECGELVPTEDVEVLESGDSYCPFCASAYLVTCGRCGELVRQDESDFVMVESGRSQRWCISCIDENACTCSDCNAFFADDCGGEVWRDETDEYVYLCPRCMEDHNRRVIHDYDFRPQFHFHCNDGENPQTTNFYGVELEIDFGGEDDNAAQCFLKILNANGAEWYAKHDGSLEGGFELVSMPSTLAFLLSDVDCFREFRKKAIAADYRSHDGETCGLHVHVSRHALGDNLDEAEATIGKILLFMDWNWDELLVLSRRTSEQLNRWAKRYGCIRESDTPLDAAYKASEENDRYTCLNLRNSETIEFRMWRGTLVPETFFATIELVDAITCYCRDLPIEKLQHATWKDFVEYVGKYSYLPDYIQGKGVVPDVQSVA